MTEPAICFDDVGVALGGRPIWQHASFALEAGQLYGIIGPNGTGKTTLLRVILGQIRPSAGSVSVLGHPPRRGNALIG
jgi:zinc/manganese transport system ATP-binding protein